MTKGLGKKHALLLVLLSTALGSLYIQLDSSATVSLTLASLKLYGLQGKQVH